MAEVKYVNVLDAIVQFKDYHTSIVLTFGANLAFYEQGVLSRIWQADCRNNLIFMDAHQYAQTTCENTDILWFIGKRYLVVPIDVGSFQSFHPKMILLLGADQARLLIGSGNLTFNGYGDNLEIFTQIDWSNDGREYQNVFSDAWRIITTIQERWGQFEQTDMMLKKAELQSPWLLESSAISDVQIISSLDTPLLDQLSSCFGKQKVEKITIFSPFIDNKSKALGKINQEFQPKNIELLLQNGKTTGDIKSLNKLRPAGVPIRFYEFEEGDRYLHAKLYLIEGKKDALLVSGSANCTSAGLLGSSASANMETLLVHRHNVPDIAHKILSKYKGSEPIKLGDTVVLRRTRDVQERVSLPISLSEIVLDGQVIVAKFRLRSRSSAVNQLVLRFTLSSSVTIPLINFVVGENTTKLSVSDKDARLLNNGVWTVSICGIDPKTHNPVVLSNSLWLTNTIELNRRQLFLTPGDEKAGQLLSEMHLGSDQEWKDLFVSLTNLVDLELNQIQSAEPKTRTEMQRISGTDSKSGDRESNLRVIESSVDDSLEAENPYLETPRESILNSWLKVIYTRFQVHSESSAATVENSDPTRISHHQPSPGIGKRFVQLVRRYISSLSKPDFMRTAPAFHSIAYFSIFQKIVWLLYKHKAIDEVKLVKFISEIHRGFFGDSEDGVPFGAPELNNHLSWRYRQQWDDNFTPYYALSSLIVIEKLTSRFDDLFTQALANICSIKRPADLLKDDTALLQIAESYNIHPEKLLRKLSSNIERLLPEALSRLDQWNTTTTVMLNDLEDDEIKIQRAALVSIEIAAEGITEHLGNYEQQIYHCTEVLFWTSQLNYSSLNNQYQERLIELLKAKGDLPSLTRALIQQGKMYDSEHNYKRAINVFLQAKSIAKEAGDPSLLRVIEVFLSKARYSLKITPDKL
jgi:hypothetical protein